MALVPIARVVCLTSALMLLCQRVAGTEDFGTVIGIDLGTTFSCVGIYLHERVDIIANNQGNRITPSYVAFTDAGERLIGEGAVNQLATNPENTAFQAKRLIGHKWENDNVQKDIDFFPFKVVKKKSMPFIRLNTSNGLRDFAPEEVSAMVLTRMKETAEDYLGKKVTHAVITVPAYFNDAQRLATKDAGTIAGLSVLRILNEPTAAAMAYGVDKRLSRTKILVFDLGGGTFDVTVLSIDDGVFRVLASNGDTHLGGEDFDRRVVEHFIQVIKKKYGRSVKGDHKAIQKLRKAAEAAKRGLSSQLQETLVIDSLLPGLDFKETLTRAKFEALNMDLFKSTMDPVRRVLEDAEVEKSELSEIVLVGGSTRIPKIQQMVKDYFDGKEPSRGINPDEAVAYGAAVQAAIFGGVMDPRIKPTLIDINALTLGIEVVGGIMSSIIPRNTALPTKKSSIYTTVEDYQTVIDINVFEGERKIVKDNHKIGSFELTGILPAKRHVPKIEVTFEIDFDGILVVTAEERGNQNKGHIVINTDQKRFSSNEIKQMVKDAQTFAVEDENQRKRVNSRNDLEQYIYKVQSQLDGGAFSGKLRAQDKRTLDEAIDVHSSWLTENPNASTNENKEQKQKLQDIVHPIVSKVYHDPSEF